jgi:hypothetical protein
LVRTFHAENSVPLAGELVVVDEELFDLTAELLA